MKTKYILLICWIIIFPATVFSQLLVNNGGHISLTNGSLMVVSQLDFLNQTNTYDGDISNAGKIFISGNWTNSATGGQLFDSASPAGEVVFFGNSTCTISGATTHFNKLTIGQNTNVNVSPANLIKVYDTFNNEGIFTLKTNTSRTAMLIDAGDPDKIIGSGIFRFERYITKDGWHYISSPCVYTSNSTNFFWGGAVYDYNETNNSWNKKTNNQQLDVMRGYDVYFKNGDKTVVFEGKYNTGQISVNLTRNSDGYNFVGNPYPTTINWDEALGWVKTNIDNAIYIWDPTLNNGQGDYMEYVNGVGNRGGTRFIPASQAFWVKCNSSYGGSLTIKNQAKCSNTSAYFRSGEDEFEVLRVKAFQPPYDNEATVSLNEQANASFEGQYDALKIFHNNISIPQVFTLSSDLKELAINALKINEQATVIPLGLRAGQDGKCTLSFDLSHISDMLNVFLEDKFTNRFIDLRANPVNVFDVLMTDDPMRFAIHFNKIQSVTGINEQKSPESKDIFCYSAGDKIYLYVNKDFQNAVYQLFDISGKNIISGKIEGKGLIPILFDFPKGAYLISIHADGNVITQKIVL